MHFMVTESTKNIRIRRTTDLDLSKDPEKGQHFEVTVPGTQVQMGGSKYRAVQE